MKLYSIVGVREPIVTCVDGKSSAIADASNCKGVAPSPGNKDCNEGECPPTYSFKVVYSKCTVTCGNGKQKLDFIGYE